MINMINSRELDLLPIFVYQAESYPHQNAIFRPYDNALLHTQFSFCRAGEGIFVDDENNVFDIKSGSLFYFRGDVPHSYEPKTTPWSVDYITCGGTALYDLMDHTGFGKSGVIHPGSEGEKNISDLFAGIISIYGSESVTRHSENSRMLLKLLYAVGKAADASARRMDSKDMNLAVDCAHFIEKNYRRNFSISEIAEKLNTSAPTMIAAFRGRYDTTPQKYLTRTRINCAKTYLLHQKLAPLSKAAEISGFSSTSYFCTVFKKHVGMTPEEYRLANLYALK